MMTTETEERGCFRLVPTLAERVWGRRDLRPWYDKVALDSPVGEAWLTGPESIVAAADAADRTLEQTIPGFPLLVKLLFPEEKLSVQVHPDDERARALGLARGKTECWYILDAEPDAGVYCGLKEGVNTDDLRSAAAGGSMEALLTWLPVAAGDMVFVDAGTVHAIGGGMTVLEVQQTCDVTYRLFDYGRPRELHLDQGLAAVKTLTRAGKVTPRLMNGFKRLIETEYFIVDLFAQPSTLEFEGPGCVVALGGHGRVNDVAFKAGEAVIVQANSASVDGDASYLRCVAPRQTSV